MDFKFSIDEESIDKIIVECFSARIKEMCVQTAVTWSGRDEIKKIIARSFEKSVTAVADKVFSEMAVIESEVKSAVRERIMRRLEKMK